VTKQRRPAMILGLGGVVHFRDWAVQNETAPGAESGAAIFPRLPLLGGCKRVFTLRMKSAAEARSTRCDIRAQSFLWFT
jgi:hypothetical protein